jgi:hypothetical protein
VVTTTIVFFITFILIHQNERAKIFPWISNQRRRIKDPRLMDRRGEEGMFVLAQSSF